MTRQRDPRGSRSRSHGMLRRKPLGGGGIRLSNRTLAGSVATLVGPESTQGQGRLPKNAGFDVRCSTVVLYQGLVHSMRCIEKIAESTRLFDDGIVLVIMGTGYDKWANPVAALAGFERIVVLPPVPYDERLPYTASADIGNLLYRR